VANKKILIITYYWPPSGGTGVQRWLHFSRYLEELGWEPIIYTPSNPEAPVQDTALLKLIGPKTKVLKQPIWEPTQLYKKLSGQKGKQLHTGFLSQEGQKKGGLLQRLSMWLRANLFIPDAKMAWIRPSVRFLTKELKQHPVAAIISTGPPHSLHLIARQLKRRTNTRWIADFRDPWTQIDWFEQLPLSRLGLRLHEKLEASVFKEADELIVVSRDMQAQMQQRAGRQPQLISNGYAPEDFADFKLQPDPHFTILHTGSINKDRNPSAVWQSLGTYVKANPDFAALLRIRLIGALDASVKQDLQAAGLLPFTDFEDFVPHERVIEALSCCSLLLLPLNNVKSQKGIVTGKLFEYLASQQPILAIGPADGDAAAILATQAGTQIIDFDTPVPWAQVIATCQNKPERTTSLLPYSRKELASQLAALLK